MWRRNAESTFDAATLLFNLNNPSVWFSAAILGHHALEMLLKSALLREGCKIAKGDVWGHALEVLASRLVSKRPEFSLKISPHPLLRLIPCKTYLARYDAFFNELRYPSASPNVDSLGPGRDEAELLSELMDSIRPFAFPLPGEELQP